MNLISLQRERIESKAIAFNKKKDLKSCPKSFKIGSAIIPKSVKIYEKSVQNHENRLKIDENTSSDHLQAPWRGLDPVLDGFGIDFR